MRKYRQLIIYLLQFLILVFVGKSYSIEKTNLTTIVKYFTPDSELNDRLNAGEADPSKIFGVSKTEEGLVINPQLQQGWTWLAAKNLYINGDSLSFFFHDGWLYTDQSILTANRRMKYKIDVSDLIHSNVFTIAFYEEYEIEKELVIFIASPNAVTAELTIDKKLWGEEKKIEYYLHAGEGHFMSIMKMADEFRPFYFKVNNVPRRIINFNNDWKFIKHDSQSVNSNDDGGWEKITLPHCWNKLDVYDTRNEYDGYEIYNAYYRGTGTYRKYFYLNPEFKNKKLFINFEGVNQTTEVWINKKYIGKHVGGYTGFSFDITDDITFGEQLNVITVKVDNSYNYDIPPHTADFIMYGGIYRDVHLLVVDKLFIKDVSITTPDIARTSAIARIRTEICNDTNEDMEVTLVTNIVNSCQEIEATVKNRKIIASGKTYQFDQQTSKIPDPNLWSPENPYLYTVYSTLYMEDKMIDEIQTPLGFRWYKFDPSNGFFLNDEWTKLKGVNKHQDYFGMGNAVPDSLQVKDLKIIKEMGANFIRLAHYPHDPAVLDACDKLGLLVWAEIPVVNSVGGKEFSENAKNMMREMIQRDRNHPSIVLWGITNESIMRFANQEQVPLIMKLLKELNEIAHQEDPTRLTVQAHNHLKDEAISEITDVIGRNRYYGWYDGVMKDFEKEMDKEHRMNPEWKIIISEYGVGSKIGYHVDNPKIFDFSEDYQLNFHEHYLKVINERSWIAGSAVWNAFDFGSVVKKGNIPRINQKGLCDMTRRPKDVYYFYQSQWTEKPMVYIVSHTQKKYKGTEGEIKKIRVYSNCDTVELMLNGKSLGRQEKQYVFFWNVSFVPGKNKLNAIARKGNKIVEDQLDIFYSVKESITDATK